MTHIAAYLMRACLPAAVLALVVAAYYPGLSGNFLFDDFANIARNTALTAQHSTLAQAALSGASGPLGRPVSMASFAVNINLTGLDPYYFKLTNLLIHLLNGIGIFWLTRLLLSAVRMRTLQDWSEQFVFRTSIAVAAAWLLHPLNLTGVLYIVQRMTSLSALFSIWGLALFVWGRTRLCSGGKGILPILAGALLFVPLATFSKENGALLPALMLAAELTLFSFSTAKKSSRYFLFCFYAITVALPLAAAITYIALHPDWLLAGYQQRAFTLPERVMTEARVLWFYLQQILVPDTRAMGLYLDDFAISHGLFRPATTLPAIVGLLALLAGAIAMRTKAPVLAFGILFFLVGHALESTVFVLDIAYEYRNYLPMYGILLAAFYYLLHPAIARYTGLRQALAALLIAVFAFGTHARAKHWSNPVDHFQTEYRHHPDSVRNNIELGQIYAGIVAADHAGEEHYYLLARGHFEAAVALDGNDAGGLLGLLALNSKRGKPVDAAWVSELARRLERAPYAANTSDKLLQLTTCHLKGECVMPSENIGSLLESALKNSGITGGDRSKLLFARSSYLLNVKKDQDAALADMRQMVASSPAEPAPRIVLIRFLTALGRVDDARKEIAAARMVDAKGEYRHELQQLESKLGNLGPGMRH